MTKVQLQFDLLRPLDEALMERISLAHSVYGILQVKLAAALDSLTVDYDASRLNTMEVEGVLLRYGLPIRLRPS